MALAAGSTEGPYRFLDKLGEGGMGEVYLVEHIALGRREALKVLRPQLAHATEFVRRFRREARASHRVHHPGIVSVYDFGQLPGGRFYLAMEYVVGERLDQLVARGALSAADALPLLGQLAEAVAHAHQHGVVHRDLKPGNVLVSERAGKRELRVLDFGIAKIIAPEYQESGVLTLQGEVFGSPAYMAPEQWQARPATPAMDVYSIGCLAFELLTGSPPFPGRRMELMHAHLTAAPPALPGVPAEVAALVHACLAKSPAERPTSGELPQRLARLAAAHPRSDFEPADTHAERAPVPSDPAWAPTERNAFPGVEPRRLKLRAQAEAVLDRGDDRAVMVALARVHKLEVELARLGQRLAALEAETAELEAAARERQGALRFAVAELSFELAALTEGVPRTELEADIAGLERQLGEVSSGLDADLVAISDRQVAATASAASCEEALVAAYIVLERALLASRS